MGIIATKESTSLITAIKELAEYMNEDPMATAVNVGNSFYLVAEEWERQNPKTPEEIAQYYRDASAYLWHLVFSNYGIAGQIKIRKFAETAFPADASVLDLGGGIGSTLIALPQKQKV